MNLKEIHHIELTVTNIQKSKDFYEKILGLKIVAEYGDFVMLTNGSFYLGLTTHKGKAGDNFSEFRTGLDHVAFEVKYKQDLDEALRWFDQNQVSHGEIKELSNKQWVLAFRDPDNIQLELSYKEK